MPRHLLVERLGRYLYEKIRHLVHYKRGDRDLHTKMTFRATVDAVIPRTPELEAELGPEHVPGGLDIGLAEYLVTYVNHGFQLGFPQLGPRGTLSFARPVAKALDVAALKLVLRGHNAEPPSRTFVRPLIEADATASTSLFAAAGPFARLSPEDRLRAIGIVDDIEISVARSEDELFEFNGGLVGQLVVGFAKLIYYSEWQGYENYDEPPSTRIFSDDPGAVQSWRQTGFPGIANGYPALRGYLGTETGSLGDGEVWTTVDVAAEPPVHILHEPGRFRENDYETADFEEVFPEETT